MAEQYEPPQITQSESADSWSNGELKNAFDPLVTKNTNDAANNYVQMVNTWQEGVETFLRSINRSIAESWEGASADAAKTAIENYCTAAQNLTQPLQDLATGMAECAAHVDKTKSSIPDAVVVDWTSYFNPIDRHILTTRQSQRQSEAREAFTNHYVNPFGEIDKKIPVLPTPSGLDISKNIPGSGITPNSGSTPGYTGTSGVGLGGGHGNDSGSRSSADSGSSSDSTAGTSGNGYSGTGYSSAYSSNSVKPSAYDSAANSMSTTPSSYTPGTSGTGSGADSSGGIGGTTQSGGGAGRSVPGTSSTTAAKNAAAAAAARNSTGTTSLGNMGGLGSKGKGDEDGEHQRPDYLVNMENTHELLGDEPRTLPGGVIGGDYAVNYDEPRRG
jgi:hypothetical protein